MVVAQLVERPLPIPEVRSSNPVIGKNLHIEHLFNVNCIEKTKIKEKEAGNGPLKNTSLDSLANKKVSLSYKKIKQFLMRRSS